MKSELKERIKSELIEFYTDGIEVFQQFFADKYPEMAKDEGIEKIAGYKLHAKYQQWYSKALPTVKQLAPDRYEEFVGLYQVKSNRKEITFENFAIYDYLRGLVIKQGGLEVFDPAAAFSTNFQQQLTILESISHRIVSTLSDIQGELQAEFFDDELAAAEELLKNKHTRAAGVLAGVALEGHLSSVCYLHSISFRKKKPTLSDYNDALKKEDLVELPVWRRIQGLVDIRNLCAHKNRDSIDPKIEDVEEMISGTKKVLKFVS